MPFPSDTINKLIVAGYPILSLITWEEDRVIETITKLGKDKYGESLSCFNWSCTDGLKNNIDGKIENTNDPADALSHILNTDGRGFYFFKDLHFYLNDPSIIRKLKDVYNNVEKGTKYLFSLSSYINIPPYLEKEIIIVDIGLPDFEEATEIFDKAVQEHSTEGFRDSLRENVKLRCVNSLLGLGQNEMELALRRVLIGREKIYPEIVEDLLEEKAQLVRKTGTLEFIRQKEDLDDVGGLENLKEWLVTRSFAFSKEAKEFGLDTPKGVLIMGISGCGKSLCSKAVASSWNLPLLRLDLNQVYSGTFGSPEESFTRAIKVVEATAPCVLWIDEIEAGLTRSGEKTSDSPASRIFGYFLTWMQEKKQPVFIAATANQIHLLPPEILRKGRFDEIFFVTLPSQRERRDIFRIHLQKRGRKPDDYDIESLAKNTEGFTGAEIEQTVVSALFESFSKEKKLDDRELVIAASSTVPLSTTMREDISKLERWAANRAVKASL